MGVTANDGIPLGNDPREQPLRQEAIRLLGMMPGLAQAVRQASAQGGFRVVMGNGNAHLFKQAADGFYKPFLRDGGKFVENVNLAKMGPDYSRLLADLAGQAQVAAIMAKLERIEKAVERSDEANRDARRRAVAGRIATLEIAYKLRKPPERRARMLSACGDTIADLKVLAGQLKSDIKAMPSPRTGWWEDLFGDRIADARKAFAAVSADMAVIAAGCRAVLDAFENLNEPEAAKAAFVSFIADMEAAGLDDAARKARLVPGTKGKPAPNVVLGWSTEAIRDLGGRFLASRRDAKPLLVRMDLRAEDLESQP